MNFYKSHYDGNNLNSYTSLKTIIMPRKAKDLQTENKKSLLDNVTINQFDILGDADDDGAIVKPKINIKKAVEKTEKTVKTKVKKTNETKKREPIKLSPKPVIEKLIETKEVVETENNTHEKVNEHENEHQPKKTVYVPPISEDNWTVMKKKGDAISLNVYDDTVKLPGDDMKLNTTWKVWIHENSNQDWSLDSYKSIYEITSIGSMWRFLSVLDNLDKNVRQYYIMRNGITPIWEDNNNKHGAICSIMIDNMNKTSRHSRGDLGVDAFSAICILVLNESFVKNNLDINGLCYSIKSRSVLIKLWIKDFESNKNFEEKLPITILKQIDNILVNYEGRNYNSKSNNKSKVSVQLKQIKPNY